MTEQTGIDKDGAMAFHKQARVLLFADGLIPFLDESVAAWADPQYLAYFHDWERTLHDFETVDAALQAWNDYSRTTPNLFDVTAGMETLTVERTHSFGAVSVKVGLSRTVEIQSEAHRRGWYKFLDDTIEREVEMWARRNASKVNTETPAPHVPASAGGSDYVNEPSVSIEHEFTDGQHRYKVKTPKFMKWGIPLYPENLKLFGYSEDAPPPLGSTEIAGYTIQVLMDGTKAKKVVGATRNV